MSSWAPTSLSVSPAKIELADGDRQAIIFDSGELVQSVTVEMVHLGTGQIVGGPVINGGPQLGTIDSVQLNGNVATVIVATMTRGVFYELSVTFRRADNIRWTRTLVIECVA